MPFSPLNIAIFTPFFAAGEENESGIGVHYRDLAIGLKNYGDDVEVFHFPYDTSTSRTWYFEGIPIHSIGIRNPRIPKIKGLGKICKITKFFHFFEANQLVRQSKLFFCSRFPKKNFNVIEASSNRGIALGVSQLKKRPPIFTRVSTTMRQVFSEEKKLPELSYRLTARFEEKQIQKSEYLVTHTKNHASVVSNLLGLRSNQFEIIPHGIFYKNCTKKKYSVSKNPIVNILFVGRLESRKGFDILLNSIPNIVRNFPNIHFDICGTGEMLEKSVSSLPREYLSKISFHGYQSRNNLNTFYEKCDIFVAPSRYESFGLVYLEAMKFSKPVIACNTGGTPEVVLHGETGLLVDSDNCSSLSRAIIKLVGNQKLREKMGKAGKKRLQDCFSMESLISKTRQHYLDNISQKKFKFS